MTTFISLLWQRAGSGWRKSGENLVLSCTLPKIDETIRNPTLTRPLRSMRKRKISTLEGTAGAARKSTERSVAAGAVIGRAVQEEAPRAFPVMQNDRHLTFMIVGACHANFLCNIVVIKFLSSHQFKN